MKDFRKFLRFAASEGLNEPLVAQFKQNPTQVPAHIHAAGFLALRREHLPRPAPIIVALHQ